ncbi:aminotransferase class I/II-fold pyridoxal phosphate-dependent enzyme [Anderseniella sp. Alg231-50]|uniref:aminotransferase class I/II-fold pyridoxal phosphate-dependent enzyme n=1 Tax=Anderseniella sp. Alg231-50 TaxID=1922226 RepID=UPI000D561C63
MKPFDPANALSARTSAIEEAAIIAMAQKAREMKAQGVDVVSLTIGEPDFDTPEAIRQAASDAMNAGFTHYAPIAGYPELRSAIAERLNQDNAIPVDMAGVILSNGAKQALTNACFATLDAGDEVIMIAPFWAAYEGIVKMAGGVPVIVSAGAGTGFKPTLDQVAGAMSDRTKLIMLNSPSNPSGAVWSAEELQALAGLVQSHPRCLVLSDEIYEDIWFEERPTSIASLPGMFERTITVNGFSKAYAMTGWRVGYSASCEPLAKAISKVQGTFTAGGNAFAQQGALAAITGPRDDVDAMRASYHHRRDLIVSLLSDIPGIKVVSPPATFYVFPDISGLLGKSAGNTRIETDVEFCHWLLHEYHLAAVPGSAFGGPGCIRLSFAAGDDDIKKAIARLAEAASALA